MGGPPWPPLDQSGWTSNQGRAATEDHPYMHETTARDARMKRSLYSRLLVSSNTG